eukprot:7299758-Lingulodinium_polyedra.AAC.1
MQVEADLRTGQDHRLLALRRLVEDRHVGGRARAAVSAPASDLRLGPRGTASAGRAALLAHQAMHR